MILEEIGGHVGDIDKTETVGLSGCDGKLHGCSVIEDGGVGGWFYSGAIRGIEVEGEESGHLSPEPAFGMINM